MSIEFAIFKVVRKGYKNMISFFRRNELKDPELIDFELADVRVVNFGTALKIDILVKNFGLTSLSISSIHPAISVADYMIDTAPIVTYTKIPPETRTGQRVSLIVPSPYLCDKKFRQASHIVSVNHLTLLAHRNNESKLIEMDYMGHTKWQREIKNYF
ncbi:hypothetical protein [Vibrio gazogenes]|uniref:Uncharacterized protein n=1 Tax=Vibrio gazogenes TaxID=687 RepID=A0A1Z2SMK3_VIBGA|nr:hypothetical protein [Vibrio gazogenes]ASA54430.1 hypothetical protein BSQ33_00935 [Vibrio gazogenes]ASA58365.1 hypothetical protein BSQ33_21535 [Vibrio gazogenes]